ncbi:hypothetical protein HDV01_003983 [Terramyces sp. JEL0728]|nr:hypothetical protein HDV01_003983 [Terramyces sp. JEL0728]
METLITKLSHKLADIRNRAVDSVARPRGVSNIIKSGGLQILNKYKKQEYQILLEKVKSNLVSDHKDNHRFAKTPVAETPIESLRISPIKSIAPSPVKDTRTEKILVFNWKSLDESQMFILKSFTELNSNYKENIQEMEYFDYINTNIGSSVFLQYPDSFKQILDGLLSVHQYKYNLTFNYLLLMVESWTAENIRADRLTAVAETQMDATLAASDMFYKIVKLISVKNPEPRVLKLLYSLVPFLKLRAAHTNETTQYFEAVASISVEFDDISPEVVEVFLKYKHLHPYLVEIIKSNKNEEFIKCILMKAVGVEETSLSLDIIEVLPTLNMDSKKLLAYPFSLQLVAGSSLTDISCAVSILKMYVNRNDIIDILPSVQAYCAHDDVLQTKSMEAVAKLDRDDQILYFIRGLLSRNGEYRDLCNTSLRNLNVQSRSDLCLFDAAYITSILRLVPGILEQFSIIESSDVYSPSFFQNLSCILQNDSRIREKVVEMKLYENLLNIIQSGIVNDLDITGCLKCLVILLKQYHTIRDFTFLQKRFLIGLFNCKAVLTVDSVDSFTDVHNRFQIASIYSLTLFGLSFEWVDVLLGEEASRDEICFPTAILDSFFMYGVTFKSFKYRFPKFETVCKDLWAEILQLYKAIDVDQAIRYKALELVSNLKLAQSNGSFQMQLVHINDFAVKMEYADQLVDVGIVDVLSRFLTVNPNNEEDYFTLNQILLLLLNFQKFFGLEQLLEANMQPLFNILQSANQIEFDVKTQTILNIGKLYAKFFQSSANALVICENGISIFHIANLLIHELPRRPKLFCSDYLVPLDLVKPFTQNPHIVTNMPSDQIFDLMKSLVANIQGSLQAGQDAPFLGFILIVMVIVFHIDFYETPHNSKYFKKLQGNEVLLHCTSIVCSISDYSFLCPFIRLIFKFAYNDISTVKLELAELHFFEAVFKMDSLFDQNWSLSKVDFIVNLERLVELLVNYDEYYLRYLLEHSGLATFLIFLISNTADPMVTYEHGGKHLFPSIIQQIQSRDSEMVKTARILLIQILKLEIHYGIDLKIDLALVTAYGDTCIGNVLAESLIQQYCTQTNELELYKALEYILHYLPIYKSKTATSKDLLMTAVLPTKIEKDIEAMILSKMDSGRVASLLEIAAVLCIDSDYTKVG